MPQIAKITALTVPVLLREIQQVGGDYPPPPHPPRLGLNLLYRYYFGKCLSELAQLVPLPYSRGMSTRYSEMILLSPILDVTRMSISTVSFLPQLKYFRMPIEC